MADLLVLLLTIVAWFLVGLALAWTPEAEAMTRLRAWWRRRHPWAVPFTAIAIPVAVAAVIAAPTAEHSTLPPGGPEVVGSETTSSSPALGLEDPTTTTTVTDLTPVTATTMPEPVEQSGGAPLPPAPAPPSSTSASLPAAGSASSIASGPLPASVNSGLASWYETPWGGLTTASRDYARGTRLRVCYGDACVVVVVNDFGPALWTGRSLDLSSGAFAALADLSVGVIAVSWAVA